MTVPLYSYDSSFQRFIPERQALRLERNGLANVVRHRKGRIARAVMFRRPDDPKPARLRDYQGKAYSYEQRLDDGHAPWALKPLTGRIGRHDSNAEYHLAPAKLRPIFIRVLLDCLVVQPCGSSAPR